MVAMETMDFGLFTSAETAGARKDVTSDLMIINKERCVLLSAAELTSSSC